MCEFSRENAKKTETETQRKKWRLNGDEEEKREFDE